MPTKSRARAAANFRAWYARNTETARARARSRYASPETKAKKRAARMRREYGIAAEDYNARLVQQDGRCAVCRQEPESRFGKEARLCVDHDHVTGAVRGLLCHHCNLLLGNSRENIAVLNAAINYLEKSAGTHAEGQE